MAIVCSGPDCSRTKLAQKSPPLCAAHYYQVKRGAPLTPVYSYVERICSFDGCGRKYKSSGWCATHYDQWRKHGRVWEIGTQAGRHSWSCREPGCPWLGSARYCPEHEHRAERCAAPGCPEMRRGKATPYCDEHARRDRWFRHKYGISLRQRDEMVAGQGGACGICHTEAALHVDHCHDTGEVRGMLCGPCNRGIGLLDHDPKRLASAISYLQMGR